MNFMLFIILPYLFCATLALDRNFSNTVLFYHAFIPFQQCDVKTNSNFTGYGYYIIQPVLESFSNSNDFECFDRFGWYSDFNKPILITGFFMVHSYTMTFYNASFTQPTGISSIGILAKYDLPNWLFFQTITRFTAVLILLILPLMAATSIWIFEARSFSLDVFYLDMIVSYFFYSETRLYTSAGRIIRFLMMLIALIFMTLYTSSLVEIYSNHKTYDGLLEPGRYFGKKIQSYYDFSIVNSIGFYPTRVYYDQIDNNKKIKQVFDDGNLTMLVHDRQLLEYVAARACNLYVILPNLKDYFGGYFIGKSLPDSDQRKWIEVVLSSRENITDKELIKRYDEDPYAEDLLSICKSKQKLDLSRFVFRDFYQLWIIYCCGLGVSLLQYLISICVRRCKNNPHFSTIRETKEKEMTHKIKETFKNILIFSSAVARLNRKRIQTHLQNKRIYKRADKLKKKSKLAFSKTQLKFGKQKLQKISYFRIFLLKKQLKSIKNKRIIKSLKNRQNVTEKFETKRNVIISLFFDTFLGELYVKGFCSSRHNFVEIVETICSFMIVKLLYYKDKIYNIKKSTINSFKLTHLAFVQQYLALLHKKFTRLNKNQQKIISEKINEMMIQFITSDNKFDPFDVMTIIFMQINNEIKAVELKRNQKQLTKVKNLLKIGINQSTLKDLSVDHQSQVNYLLRKVKLSNLIVKNNRDNFVIDLPGNNGKLIYCPMPEKRLAPEVYKFKCNQFKSRNTLSNQKGCNNLFVYNF